MNLRQQMVEQYGPQVLKRSALNIREGAGVFEKVLSGKGYRTALEIGTYRGVSAAEMSRFVDRVVTIDLIHGRREQLGETFDRQAFWMSLGIENIALILVKDDAQKAEVIDSLEFDFAFVDGAHDETVANDFALVKRCGRVLFHDVDKRGSKEKDFVYNFVMSLPKDEVQVLDIFALWTA